jgi:MYXO-CTERM domain-containing protein
LTVTTYGIPWYPAGTDPSLIVGLNPTIVQQFVVQAVPTPAAVALLGLGGLVATRRRRR